MERYDYLEAVKEDVKEYIKNEAELDVWELEYNRDKLEQKLYDELWTVDSVTGNGSGSYTFNAWKAEEYLCHNLDLLGEALSEFGSEPDYMAKNGAEACDVTIRCYLLGRAISDALDEIMEELEEEQ